MSKASIRTWLKALRVKHYVKNLYVLIPAFFAARIDFLWNDSRLLLAFVGFCAAASAVYLLNDWQDRAKDRSHPVKKHRPIASGAISKSQVFTAIAILLSIMIATGVVAGWPVLILLVSYVLMNVAYSSGLKNIPVLDVGIVSVGFLIRIFVGGTATGLPISKWLVLMIFLLSLFQALNKRKGDIDLAVDNVNDIRPSLSGYNLEFLNVASMITAAILIVCYIMYTVSDEVVARLGSDYVYLSSFFVILGVFRYLQISIVEKDAGSPIDILMKDRFIQITVVLWLVFFGLMLYVD